MNPSEGSGPKVAAILPHIFRMNSEFDKKAKKAAGPFDYAESVFAESMLESLPSTVSQSSNSIGAISKDLTTFKERISEIKDPPSVKKLRWIFISLVLFLIAIVSNLFFTSSYIVTELVISIVSIRQLEQQFTFVGDLADRFNTIMLATNRVRTFTAILDIDDPFKPTFTSRDFDASKQYVMY